MLPYFWYILKVILCSGILFGYYWLFLRNKIFHQYNRFYLLAALTLSLLLPNLKIDFWQQNTNQSQVIKALQVVSAGDEYMSNVIISANKSDWSIQQVYPVVYWAVSFIFLFILLQTLFVIRSLLKRYPVQLIDKFSFVNTDDKSTPFSFFKYIFWNTNIDIDTATGKQIFKHEVAHIQEKHTYDKLFVNIILIFFWCNPFFWLYRKELNMIHEFIADKKAVEDSDTASFAAMILQVTYPRHSFELTNNFFYSPIKRRLLMLTKNNNPKVNYIGRIMVLPLTVLVFAAFTLKSKSNHSIYHGKKITVVIDAGHGGQDGGSKSAEGVFEKDLTLAIAKKIKEFNSNDAIEIILTRNEDVYMNPEQKTEFAKSKNANLIISFHVDGTPKLNQKSGMSILIARDQFTNAKQSKVLASSLLDEFSKNYGLTVFPVPQQREKGVWILQSNDVPTVLVEAGYITNTKDVAYLQTNDAKETIARNVLAAIEKFAVAQNENRYTEARVPVNDTLPSNMFVNTKHADAKYLESDEFRNKALVIVDSREVGNLGARYIEKNSSKYSSVVLYNPTEARKTYGEKGKYGVLKLTQKDAVFIKADSVFYDEKNGSIKLSGSNSTVTGDLSNTLIYVDGKIVSPAELNVISPATISSVNILKGDKLDGIIEAKGKTAVIQVNLKPSDLAEVVVGGYPAKTETPVAIALDKMNVFYIGVDNPITIAVPNIPSDKLLVTINNGLIKGSSGKYIVRVTTLGEATITVATIKDDRKVLLSTQTFRVKRIPDPVNGQVPIDFDIKYKIDSGLYQQKKNEMLLLEQQYKISKDMAEKTVVGKKLQEQELSNLKQKLVSEYQSKAHLYMADKKVAGKKLQDQELSNLNQEILSEYRYKTQLYLADKTLNQVKLKNLQALTQQQKQALEQQNKLALDMVENKLLNNAKDSALMNVLLQQKEILTQQNNLVFKNVEVSPMFTGGDNAWRTYLIKNLKANTPVEEGWKSGKFTVIVKFIVHTDGTVSDVTTENYKGSKTAQHCIEVIKNAPKWQPAVQNGKKVNAWKKQPITFVIEE